MSKALVQVVQRLSKEVAHLQKHAAFWSLHIKPVARLIVMATDSEEMKTFSRKSMLRSHAFGAQKAPRKWRDTFQSQNPNNSAAVASHQDVSGKYRELLEVENGSKATAAPDVSQAAPVTWLYCNCWMLLDAVACHLLETTKANEEAELWPDELLFQKRNWGTSDRLLVKMLSCMAGQ